MTRFAHIVSILALTALVQPLMAAENDPATAWQRTFSEVIGLAYRDADRTIRYGEADPQFVELWLPRDGVAPAPVVALIHGGCWLAEYDISHIRPLASALADQGYAVWAIEYRRVGQEGGGWPGTFHDVSVAMDRLATFRDPLVDTDRTVMVGHSAGGHLALWAAGRSRLNEDDALYRARPFLPAAVVGLAAIADLEAYATGDNSCQQVTARLMDGLPDERPDRYRQASPSRLGSGVPVTLLHGKADHIVPPSQARAMGDARTRFLDGAGHFDLIHPQTPAFRELLGLLQELTNR